MASVNAYTSFKRVNRFPDNATPLARGHLDTGHPWTVGLDPDEITAALLLDARTCNDTPIKLRLGLQRLIESIVSAEAADADRWEPLTQVSTDESGETWTNSIVTCHVERNTDFVHLSYHRRDRAPIRNWRIGQRLKNQLVGPTWEGAELCPSEERVVDSTNQYHLWCFPELPFGFDKGERATQDQIDETASSEAVQRDDPYADTSRFDPNIASRGRATVRTPIRPLVEASAAVVNAVDPEELSATIVVLRKVLAGRPDVEVPVTSETES